MTLQKVMSREKVDPEIHCYHLTKRVFYKILGMQTLKQTNENWYDILEKRSTTIHHPYANFSFGVGSGEKWPHISEILCNIKSSVCRKGRKILSRYAVINVVYCIHTYVWLPSRPSNICVCNRQHLLQSICLKFFCLFSTRMILYCIIFWGIYTDIPTVATPLLPLTIFLTKPH